MSNSAEGTLHRESQNDTSTSDPDFNDMAQTDALDDMEFLDDIDFTLEDVESKIAPLALAHS